MAHIECTKIYPNFKGEQTFESLVKANTAALCCLEWK